MWGSRVGWRGMARGEVGCGCAQLEADTLQLLQHVRHGSGVATGIVGKYLRLRDRNAAESTRVSDRSMTLGCGPYVRDAYCLKLPMNT